MIQGSSPNNVDTTAKVKAKVATSKPFARTVSWDKLPAWQQDNHYIRTGYRPASNCFYQSFGSLSYLHNETVNIYSHLLGAVVFTSIGSFLYVYMVFMGSNNYDPHSYFSYCYDLMNKISIGTFLSVGVATTLTSTEKVAFSCFFAGAILCLALSGTYHTISNHSPVVAQWGNKMDYLGIVCLIVGSFIPSIYYGFLGYVTLQRFYWNMISTLGLGCATVTIFDRFRTPAWRPYRAAMFVAMGLSAIFPVIHGIKIFGLHTMQYRIGLTGLVLEGFFYILGAGLYATRWPERSKPGFFDIWGSSHQIFHILVLIAAGFHFYSLRTAYIFHHHVISPEIIS